MGYRTRWVDATIFIRWLERIEVRDIEELEREMKAKFIAARQRLTIIALHPGSAETPDGTVRDAFVASMKRLEPYLHYVMLILEGSGILHAIKTSIATSINVITGGKRQLYIRRSLEDAFVRRPPRELGDGGAALLRSIQREALLD